MSEVNAKISFVKALMAVQASMRPVERAAKNPYFNSKYATLEDVWQNCGSLLFDNGFAVLQTVQSVNGQPHLATTLLHVEGHSESSFIPLKPQKDGGQALGSEITYARRYGLMAIVGMCSADDDGEAAQNRPQKASPKPAEKRQYNGVAGMNAAMKKKASGNAYDRIANFIKTNCDDVGEMRTMMRMLIATHIGGEVDPNAVTKLEQLTEGQLETIAKNLD